MADAIIPVIGMGCTEILYTDRYAMTIVRVITPNKIEVAYNATKCLDYFGGDYEILKTFDKGMGTRIYTRRKSGRWIALGSSDTRGAVRLAVGVQRHYIDPCF